MEKKCIEINFELGHSIDSAIEELNKYKKQNILVCGSFNGQMLYSDVDDVDSAYKKVTGKTKTESDEESKKAHLKYEEDEKKHKEAVPELTKEWTEKGKEILEEKYLELWNTCVPIRLDDLYHGMELGACLAIVKELNAGCDFEVAKKIIEGQGHSGMSFGLVRSMVRSFCERGEAFSNYIKR